MLQCAGEFELLRLKGKLSKILERLKTFLTHLVLVNFTKNHLTLFGAGEGGFHHGTYLLFITFFRVILKL